MICKNCGQEIDNVAKFCEHCGAKVRLKSKKKKPKRIIMSILSVIVVIVLAYASRFLLFDIATNCIWDLNDEPDCINSLTLYESSIEANLTDDYLKPKLLNFTDWEGHLYIYTDGENYYSYTTLINTDESSIGFSTGSGVSYGSNYDRFYDINNLDLKNREIYRVCVEISAYPKFNRNQIFNKVDWKLGLDTCISGVADAYFMYENGQFIKISET